MGHDPQQEQALFAVAGGWKPGCIHMPRHTQNDSTHTARAPTVHPRVCLLTASHRGYIQVDNHSTLRAHSCTV